MLSCDYTILPRREGGPDANESRRERLARQGKPCPGRPPVALTRVARAPGAESRAAQITVCSVYTPNTSRSTPVISPSVAYARAASRI